MPISFLNAAFPSFFHLRSGEDVHLSRHFLFNNGLGFVGDTAFATLVYFLPTNFAESIISNMGSPKVFLKRAELAKNLEFLACTYR